MVIQKIILTCPLTRLSAFALGNRSGVGRGALHDDHKTYIDLMDSSLSMADSLWRFTRINLQLSQEYDL